MFVKVSGYLLAELVGNPHNIMRHPDMPRVMFKVVWEQLAAGHPVAAYIKNLAKDGSFYWVMAMITPCEGGYLSVRLKPSTPHFDTARELSLELLALEQKTEGHDPRRRSEAIEASRLLLQQRLHDAGYADYTAFMREALLAEVRARTLLLARGRHGTAAVPADADGDMRVILAASAALSTFLERLVGKLDQYGALNEQLAAKARFVSDLAADVGLFSMNALVAATHMREVGVTLRAVAGLIQTQSATSRPVFQSLTDDVAAAVEKLAGMFFPIAATSLQADMLTTFVAELLEVPEGLRATAADFGALAACLADGIDHLDGALNGLNMHLSGLGAQVAGLKADLKIMRALELQGRIEMARVNEAGGVESLFRTMAGQIETASHEMDDLLRSSTFLLQKS